MLSSKQKKTKGFLSLFLRTEHFANLIYEKTLKQKGKKPNWWSKSRSFLEKPCSMEPKA